MPQAELIETERLVLRVHRIRIDESYAMRFGPRREGQRHGSLSSRVTDGASRRACLGFGYRRLRGRGVVGIIRAQFIGVLVQLVRVAVPLRNWTVRLMSKRAPRLISPPSAEASTVRAASAFSRLSNSSSNSFMLDTTAPRPARRFRSWRPDRSPGRPSLAWSGFGSASPADRPSPF